jgi:hypothetical protein
MCSAGQIVAEYARQAARDLRSGLMLLPTDGSIRVTGSGVSAGTGLTLLSVRGPFRTLHIPRFK